MPLIKGELNGKSTGHPAAPATGMTGFARPRLQRGPVFLEEVAPLYALADDLPGEQFIVIAFAVQVEGRIDSGFYAGGLETLSRGEQRQGRIVVTAGLSGGEFVVADLDGLSLRDGQAVRRIGG